MNQPSTQIKIQALSSQVTCDTDDNLSKVTNKFMSTHAPLFAFDANKKFFGLLTVDNTLLKRKYNPSTPVHSCLINPPKLFRDTAVSKIIRLMRGLKLYSLPVFNHEEQIIGIVTAKNILKELIKNKLLFELLAEKKLRKKVSTIPQNCTVGYAFQQFAKKGVSRLAVVDKKGKLTGIVTKRDILLLYLTPSNRQRFSTRLRPKNYSFDTEQIKRDSQPITKYFTPVTQTHSENLDNYSVIKNLLDSLYNAIILNDKNRPVSIVTMRDILKEVIKISEKIPSLPIVLSKLPKELNNTEKQLISKDLRKLSLWINKQERVQLVNLTTKTAYTPQRKPTEFEIKLEIITDLNVYNISDKSRDFLTAFQKALKQAKKQVRRGK